MNHFGCSDNVEGQCFKVTRHDIRRQFGVCEEDVLSLGGSSDHFHVPGSWPPSDLCLGTAPQLGVDGDAWSFSLRVTTAAVPEVSLHCSQ